MNSLWFIDVKTEQKTFNYWTMYQQIKKSLTFQECYNNHADHLTTCERLAVGICFYKKTSCVYKNNLISISFNMEVSEMRI